MFGKSTDTHRTTTHDAAIDPRARGGVAFGPILTGVVVAFGAMFLLSALVGGFLASAGVIDTNVTTADVVDVGIGAGIALVVAQFLSYLWGGYTAGRMARGSGAANGGLVPLTAIIVAVLVGAIATALGATANLNLPFTTNQLPLENSNLVDWGIGIGIASLVAMFLGGILGGAMGARWHTKLERAHGEEVVAHRDTYDTDHRDHEHTAARTEAERREVDLRDAERRPVPTGGSTSVNEPVDLNTRGTGTTPGSGTTRPSDTSTYRR